MKNLFSKLACGLVFAGVAGSSLVGCGDDSNGSSGVNSGVDGTKKGEDVTDAEAVKICEAIGDYSASKAPSKAQVCQITGASAAMFLAATDAEATDAEIQAACTDAAKACTDAEEEPTTEDDSCKDETAPTSCTSTVAEVEACAQALVDQQAAAWKNIPSCDSLTRASIEADDSTDEPSESDSPAACDTVFENCPEAL